MSDNVILVDVNDNETGVMSKEQAHIEGALHRAFSVFIFNSKKELLLQKRAAGKYHSAGLWSNTCCSHPAPGEDIEGAAKRRLREELGMECDIAPAFSFIYKVDFENGLKEHELDHVFVGICDDLPVPAPVEVQDTKYISLDDLAREVTFLGRNYTIWLRICLPRVIDFYNKRSYRIG